MRARQVNSREKYFGRACARARNAVGYSSSRPASWTTGVRVLPLPHVDFGVRPRGSAIDWLRVDSARAASVLGRRNSNCQESGRSGGGVSLDEPPQAAMSKPKRPNEQRAAWVRIRMASR